MRGRIQIAAVSLVVTVLAGCSSPMASFYTLSVGAAPETAAPAPAESKSSIAVGLVTVPAIVDRPQLVVRVGANQVAVLEQHRWAEPLKSEIPRVIADNLAKLLGTTQVSAYPQSAGDNAEYQVQVDIQRFESTLGGTVVIEALWSVRRFPDGQPKTGRSLVQESTGGGAGYDALVAAHSRALATVSRDIAAAIRSAGAPAR